MVRPFPRAFSKFTGHSASPAIHSIHKKFISLCLEYGLATDSRKREPLKHLFDESKIQKKYIFFIFIFLSAPPCCTFSHLDSLLPRVVFLRGGLLLEFLHPSPFQLRPVNQFSMRRWRGSSGAGGFLIPSLLFSLLLLSPPLPSFCIHSIHRLHSPSCLSSFLSLFSSFFFSLFLPSLLLLPPFFVHSICLSSHSYL